MPMEPLQELASLLRKRLSVISDHALRDSNPEQHLAALQQASEEISARHLALREAGQLTPRLEHFLANCSYAKALDLIEQQSQ